MARGRKPKPNEQKLLSGSKHANNQAIEFEKITNIDPPEWITGLAEEMWLRVCPVLCEHKILSGTDIHNLEVFCSAYGVFREADIEVAKEGLTVMGSQGGYVKNPALTAKNEAARQMATFGALLGLDPASRGRFINPDGSGGGNEFHGF
ncbi:phage terminase small subunit P27 family [Neptuniibacter sp.]|uniref:phage terminase small subunit P27 family n=1 Tax=Neptuniibacter sp. TaxID=1962643 RepID=UPI002616F53C|nr:phage terminase small subunit P27 family [Neptuniibacter sp.]MCP4597785.1 phage terminase small subunit P27 family [Neptuniibacter sp.]